MEKYEKGTQKKTGFLRHKRKLGEKLDVSPSSLWCSTMDM